MHLPESPSDKYPCTAVPRVLRSGPWTDPWTSCRVGPWLQGDPTTTVTVDDSFERCAMHGLAAFHGLVSAGVTTSDGARGVRLRRPAPTESAPAAAPASPSRIPAGGAAPRSWLSSSRSRTRANSPGGSVPRDAALGTESPEENPVRGSSAQPVVSVGASASSAGAESGRGADPGGSVLPNGAGVGQAGWRSGGEGGGGTPRGEGGATAAIPFTAVDVLMVLHEDAVGRAEAGVTAGLTAAALRQHRTDHLPPELAGVL